MISGQPIHLLSLALEHDKLISANLLLKELDANAFVVRNKADSEDRDLKVRQFRIDDILLKVVASTYFEVRNSADSEYRDLSVRDVFAGGLSGVGDAYVYVDASGMLKRGGAYP